MNGARLPDPADLLTPEAFRLLDAIGRAGSFAGAARELGLVPSALTYRVRQIEDALDVLLFDRSSRQARATPAGVELLAQGARLKQDVDAVVRRVQRVATGWEPSLTIAVDGVIAPAALMELCQDFFALDPPTRLRLRDEVLSGTLAALTSGQADLALGVMLEPANAANLRARPLGHVRFVYAIAPTHPLASVPEPLSDSVLLQHRAVVVADSAPGSATLSFGLLAGQATLTVASLQAKLAAHLRGLGVGFLPEPLARPWLAGGQLVERRLERSTRTATLHYAWPARTQPGQALSWWLERLERPITRRALLQAPANV
ncbi:LysR family transcriptional regulator [Ottowia pentelensis]|uniref:LysR family transcriptional regulator n=1 Tax=Ottowia pentelensis TaxID=511108 RepID=A0ABV6PWF2_9BURK